METRTLRRSAIIGVMALLALSSCTGRTADNQPEEQVVDEPVELWEAVETSSAWTLAGYTPMSPAVATDGGFVLYALDSDAELSAIGVDGTGEVRWQHPANQSWIVSGVGLSTTVSDGLAVFLAAQTPEYAEVGWVQVVAVDAVTGQVQWTSPDQLYVSSHPEFCGEDEQRLCLIGSDGDGPWWRILDLDDGQELAAARLEDSRRLGDRLFPANDSADLVRVGFDAQITWQRSIREMFGTADVDPDHGWHFRNQDGRFVGRLGGPWEEVSEGVHRRDLGEEVLAAFDEATGEPLWAERGTRQCSGIDFTLDYPVRCRSAGHYLATEQEGSGPNSTEWTLEGEITVEGFDPATGATTWSWEAGEVPGLAFAHESVRRIDDTVYLVTTASGEQLLDVATGHHQPVTDPPPAWCTEDGRYEPAGRVTGRLSDELRVTQRLPCHADGTAVDLPVTVPEFAGARVDDIFAWVADGQLRAVMVLDGAG